MQRASRLPATHYPKHWTLKGLGSFCKISSGGTPRRLQQSYFGGEIPWVKIGDMEKWIISDTEEKITQTGLDNSSAKIFPKGTILVSIFATIGAVSILGVDAATNQAIAGVIPDERLADNLYLAYYLASLKPKLESISRGVAQRNINQTILKSIQVPLPPLDEQRLIVSVIERVRDLGEKRKQVNQLTDRIIQSVFLKLFGNMKPQSKIGDVATFVSSGSTPLGGARTYVKDGITFIREQNVLMNSLDLREVARISTETHRKMRRTWVRNGDVLLNITGASLGRVATYRGKDYEANVNQHVCIIRLNKGKALPEYVSFYLSTSGAQRQIWMIQAGASRQALNFQQVKSLDLFLPGVAEQERFLNYMTQFNELRNRQTQSTEAISEFFHSLMHKAFDGQLVT